MHYKATLKILTPVIINTGQCYEFGELYPRPDGRLFQLRLSVLLSRMSGHDRNLYIDSLSAAVLNKDNRKLKEARDVLYRYMDKEVILRPCRALKEAAEVINEKPLHQIQKIAENPRNGQAYIPGSSVKGALRTGILESLRARYGLEPYKIRDKKYAKDFEAEIYSGNNRFDVSKDPFKHLKISDFDYLNYKTMTYIGRVAPMVYTAMSAAGCLDDFKSEVLLSGTVTAEKKDIFRDFLSLLDGVDSFYSEGLSVGRMGEYFEEERAAALKKEIAKAREEGWKLLRLGHYCGLRNCTFNVENPNLKSSSVNIEGGRLSLIENGYPAGICLLKLEED